MSDEGSKKADSDSHPENWTDHEASDPQPQASSPPKSGDDKKVKKFETYFFNKIQSLNLRPIKSVPCLL